MLVLVSGQWDYQQHGKVDNTEHKHICSKMDCRDSSLLILSGLNTGFGMVNQSTTGSISAATFHAALGVRSLLYTGWVYHHCERKGCDKWLESSTKENIYRGNKRKSMIMSQIYGVCPAEHEVLPDIKQPHGHIASTQIWMYSPGRSCRVNLYTAGKYKEDPGSAGIPTLVQCSLLHERMTSARALRDL